MDVKRDLRSKENTVELWRFLLARTASRPRGSSMVYGQETVRTPSTILDKAKP